MITPTSLTPRFDTAPTTTTQQQSSTQAPATPGGDMGKDQFMQLLIAQLQNQDPTSPMDGSQMAAQLAQFSSLEQLQNINTTLTGQSTSDGTLLGAIQASSAIATMGHTVTAVGNQFQLGGTNAANSVTISLAAPAVSGTLHVYDAAGNEVGTKTLNAMNSGQQTISLDGATNGLGDGTYTYSVDAKDAAGTAVTATTYSTGKVDGISTGANGMILTAGGMTIPYGNVVSISN
ncbi:MAG TPA: flagellar hook capping FlgD N-terminal domain-containing protein [Gemmatimonadaceae bacterium]|jgi:flagellar basal-body rod modification protein FlgD